jgi:hypothetical protein
MGTLLNFARWLLGKTAGAGLILAVGLAAGGLWLFLRDNVDFDEWRRDVQRTLSGERAKVQAALGDVQQRMDRMAAELAVEKAKGEQADKVVARIRKLDLQASVLKL